jgi:hypothetical protein
MCSSLLPVGRGGFDKDKNGKFLFGARGGFDKDKNGKFLFGARDLCIFALDEINSSPF